MPDVIGRPPVHPAPFVLSKIALTFSLAVLFLRLAGVDLLGVTFNAARVPAAVLAVIGVAFVAAGLLRLGQAARVGLPRNEDAAVLRTAGVYAVSRNPVYVGGLLACVASCLYVPHWLNIAAVLVTAAVHHCIVRAEESFMRNRFGRPYDEYCARVRRYL